MADQWVPLAHAFEKHDVKSHDDVRKLWPKGLDRNHLKLGPDGNAHVKVTPELRAADLKKAAEAAKAPQGGYVVPSTMTGGSDSAYGTAQDANSAAMADMQANPMAYMRYAHATQGQGIQMNQPVAQFEPMTITAKAPKHAAKQAPQPKTAEQAATMADPTASPRGRAAFDAVIQGGKKAVADSSAKRGEPLVEVGAPEPVVTVGTPRQEMTVPGVDVSAADKMLADAEASSAKHNDAGRKKVEAASSGKKVDRADLIKIAHHALKMHDALAEDE